MEKISGIVPSSRRVSSVDMKNAPPVRPGTPSFGRPQGISTLTEQNKPTTAQLAIAKQKELTGQRSLSEKSPAAIQELADRFFMQQKKEAGVVEDFDLNLGWRPPVRSKDTSFETEVIDSPVNSSAPREVEFASPEAIPAEEVEFTPPGSYLNVVA